MLKLAKLWISGWLLFGCGSIWAGDFVVIANPSVPVTSISPDDLNDIYLLRTTAWDDGSRIVPINRESGSNLRNAFTSRILKQRQEALNNYWDKMHYKGLTPPLIQESDQAILTFVQRVPGAIGYINAATEPRNVKVLKVQTEAQ